MCSVHQLLAMLDFYGFGQVASVLSLVTALHKVFSCVAESVTANKSCLKELELCWSTVQCLACCCVLSFLLVDCFCLAALQHCANQPPAMSRCALQQCGKQ